MANVHNAKRAQSFSRKPAKRAASVSRHETLYLEALEAFYKQGANDKSKRQGWLQGLETIVQEFPADVDARAWLAIVTWQNAMDGIGSRQAVDTLLDCVFQVEPMHPGAHHYRIHLWDGHKPARAEKSAGLYAAAAPGIAHAWHMPGHTYSELKRYADAAYQQEGSARVDHAYMMRDRVMPFEIHNYVHNNQWLCTTLSHIGRVRDAIAVARNLVEQPRDPEKNGPNDGGSAQRSGRARWAELLTRYELWDELLDAAASGALDWSNIPFEQQRKAYTLGLAYAAKNDQAKLVEQIKMLKKHTGAEAKPLLAELEGLELLARGEIGPAFDQFAKATFDAARGACARPSGRPQLWICRNQRATGRRKEPQSSARPGGRSRSPSRLRERTRGPRGLSFARAARPPCRPRPPRLQATGKRRGALESRGLVGRLWTSDGQRRRHRRDCRSVGSN